MALKAEDKALLIGSIVAALTGIAGVIQNDVRYGVYAGIILAVAATLKAVLGG